MCNVGATKSTGLLLFCLNITFFYEFKLWFIFWCHFCLRMVRDLRVSRLRVADSSGSPRWEQCDGQIIIQVGISHGTWYREWMLPSCCNTEMQMECALQCPAYCGSTRICMAVVPTSYMLYSGMLYKYSRCCQNVLNNHDIIVRRTSATYGR